MSDLDLDRVAWIDERVNYALLSYGKIRDNCAIRFDACQILSVVEEFAELLRVHYAGDEEIQAESFTDYNIEICETCYMTFHGLLEGDIPEPAPLNLINENMMVDDSGDGYSFGKSPCDGCGDRLYGNRFIMNVTEVKS